MLVYGRNVVNEILNGKTKIYKVFLDNNYKDEDILNKIDKRGLKKFHVDKSKLDKMCGNSTNQGIAMDIEEFNYYDIKTIENDDKSNFVVMLDSIEDPHNFGAIIRTCECAGVDYIIIPKNRSVSVNSTVYKTSSGALSNMKIVEVANLHNTIKKLKDLGFWVYGSDAKGKDYRSIDFGGKTCLIIGSEGHGLKQIVSNSCDEIISLPMKGKINSLNASVAAGIFIYEIMKYK
ncbi:MAG: 23S rRNA (guanosine(2251)-2'-O)-methyltransferase RlmB [Mollicutes bacterium]|nr:23S rRNA (guanosine(2251)-2'-O)-methyltransferase RlmB [Mollicutes bacterium]